MKKKLLIGAGIISVILVGFLLWRKRPVSLFKVETVNTGEMIASISASGKIKAEHDAILQFQTGGLLSWVGVKKGDQVRKGQAIASLDTRQIRKQLQKYLNVYMSQRDDFEQIQDDYRSTKENFLVTDAIKRVLDKAQNSLNNSVLDVELSDLSLQLSTIHSPFNGIIISVDSPYPGVNVLPTGGTFRVVDPKSLYFEAQVDETEIAKVRVGDKVNVKLEAYPDQIFDGVVSQIDFDSTVTSGGGTAYNLKITFTDSKDTFKLGMNGDAQIIQTTIEKALLVPISSIIESDNKAWVWKVEKNKAKRLEVTVGQTNDDFAQILSGLSEQDKIIISNLNRLKEGMTIKP